MSNSFDNSRHIEIESVQQQHWLTLTMMLMQAVDERTSSSCPIVESIMHVRSVLLSLVTIDDDANRRKYRLNYLSIVEINRMVFVVLSLLSSSVQRSVALADAPQMRKWQSEAVAAVGDSDDQWRPNHLYLQDENKA